MKKFVGVLLSLWVLTGCAQSGLEPDQPSIGNLNETLAEYKDSVEAWPQPLPEGESFPDTPAGLSKEESYEEGFGTSFVAFYWRCAWMGKYLNSFDSDDSSGQIESLEYLDQWRDFAWVQEHVVDDPDGGWEQVVLQPARLGDPTVMRRFHESC